MILWREDGSIYVFYYPGRFNPDDLEKIPKPSSPLPANIFEAPRDPSLSCIGEPFPPDSYLKTPAFIVEKDIYERIVAGESCSLGMNMLQEAEVYEKLRLKPHPNICHFYGCVLSPQGDTIKALCLRRYKCTLQETLDATSTLDAESIMQDVRDGLTHLHKMGLAHNDLNPSNVMLDNEGRAILIDFDSCLPIGASLNDRKCGTPNWEMDPPPVTSERDNDWFAFTLLQKHLHSNSNPRS
jgi:serine/threonine protein kinase